MTSRASSSPWVPAGVAEPTQQEFDGFRDVIRRHTGISLNPSKRALLYARLARRVQQAGLHSFGEYLARVLGDAGELEQMVDRIATNETHFFREPAHFDCLRDTMVPGWIRAADAGLRRREIRVWSAGCSTGEEPYSIAMALLDQLDQAEGWTVRVFATDISTRVLDVARQATWSMDRAREVPPRLLKRFMLQGIGSQAGKMRASPELRSVVQVEALNLSDPGYAVRGPFDMVLCRNVLIYFDQQIRRRVVEQLTNHVAAGGYFLVGHAESVQGIAGLTSVRPTIYRMHDAWRRRS